MGAAEAMAARLLSLYKKLLAAYGPQGWWPLPSRAGRKGFDGRGYHRGNYDWPRSASEKFEIIVGAILTQNTAWTNVEMALQRLRAEGLTHPADLAACATSRLGRMIRSSGYYNQKAKKLKVAAKAFREPSSLSRNRAPSRDALLSLWGIGRETADSILLYVFQQPFFVVDAYTRRLLERLGMASPGIAYDDLQAMFHAGLPRSHELYNEMHALIVEHAKRHCRTRPLCAGCPVARSCAWRRKNA